MQEAVQDGLANGENGEERHSSGDLADGDTVEERTPKSLVYLDRLCDRRRVECVVHTLAAAAVSDDDRRLVPRLRDVARRHSMSRLCRIIDNIEALSVAALH